MHRAERFLALSDFEAAGHRHLPRMLHGFVAGAAETDQSLRDNRAAFGEWGFVPRALLDTSARTQETTLLGATHAAPFGIAPMGAGAVCAYRSDIVLARAAAAAGIPMVTSASSLIPLEEIRAAGSDWYQAYLPGEEKRIEALVERVARAGYGTFVLTADVPVPANRENNLRNGFSIPIKPSVRLVWEGATHPRWLLGTFARTLLRHGMPHFENMDAHRGPPILSRDLVRQVGSRDRLDWSHVALIRRLWKGPLVIKGLLAAEDVVRAREAGADAVILSNHGGRQLDGAVAPLRVLPEAVAAAPGFPLLLDGGVRRGTDVLKALALGARFVFVGRPFLFAAALGGEAGVARAIALLKEEIHRNMALLGITSASQLDPGFLRRVRE
ncbi:alpha-hydroxy acid oxidase [Sabulicella rubraurantiaca]|uniref:alpha-hydroxy acid oxidase n=1 Tax=Sabulicella rubraurantiaca TaxID=2811429 RepID=UPI001A979D98|nr:alpha-hydroxy acid oxidase [Sabulicella rubraurantiaca]